jgi:hypothetical protein
MKIFEVSGYWPQKTDENGKVRHHGKHVGYFVQTDSAARACEIVEKRHDGIVIESCTRKGSRELIVDVPREPAGKSRIAAVLRHAAELHGHVPRGIHAALRDLDALDIADAVWSAYYVVAGPVPLVGNRRDDLLEAARHVESEETP